MKDNVLAPFNTMRVVLHKSLFMHWIESKVLNDHWSFDAAVGYAKHQGVYLHVMKWFCTKTLYNYLHQGLLGYKSY